MANRILTVPNQLTFLRLGFLPFFIIFVLYRRYSWALAILVLAALTDGMDGMLARTLHQKTALGAYLDPIADKLLLSSSFVALALEGQIRWWLTILVLGRDVLILTTAAVILATVGYQPFPPSIYGKITTSLEIGLVFVVLLIAVFYEQGYGDAQALATVRQILGYLVAGFTVFSGFHYSIVVAHRLSKPQEVKN
ncbi:MAG TPA: CDP-alcohol phosphatidyltransferase family protein [Candidatus Acidoferrales bacterium]|jgi:cardiolipin synthase